MKDTSYHIEASAHRCAECASEIEAGRAYYSTVSFLAEAFARRDYCVPCWPRVPRAEPRSAPGRAATGGGSDAASVAGASVAGASVAGASGADASVAGASVAGASVAGANVGTAVFAFWRAQRPQSTESGKRRLYFDTDVVLEFFRRLGDAPQVDAPEPEDSDRGGTRPVFAPGPSPAQRSRLRFVLALLLIRKKALLFESSAMRDEREYLLVREKANPEAAYWVENPNLGDDELERVRDDVGELLQMNV